jgi:hypothetical protein
MHQLPQPSFGPWNAGLPLDERLARFRSFRAIAFALARPQGDFIDSLRRAEQDPQWRERSRALFDQLPSLTRLLATWASFAERRP